MKKVLISVFAIWFGISVTYLLITSSILPFDKYLEHINTHLPSFKEVYKEIVEAVQNIGKIGNTTPFGTNIFKNIAAAFELMASLATRIFNLIYQIVAAPIRLIVYIFNVIFAFIPFMN